MTKPLSAHSEVLDPQRKWKPDWYSWLLEVEDRISTGEDDLNILESIVATNTANIATNTANIATNTANIATNTSNIAANTAAIAALQALSPAGLIYGLDLSNNGANPTTRVDVAAGRAAANTSFSTMILASTLTKRLDANWAVGNNNGGLDTGSAVNGVYYIHLIARSDTGVVDWLYSLSATAPTMPTNYDRRRRIGSIRRSGGIILPFNHQKDRFTYVTGIADAASITVGTSRTLVSVSVPPNMLGTFRVYGFNSATNPAFVIQPTFETDAAPGFSAAPGVDLYSETTNRGAAGVFEIAVDGSSQIAIRADSASSTVTIITKGYHDDREQFG